LKKPFVALGEASTFGSFHPIVTFLYFSSVILITMFSKSPVFLALTFLAGFLYSILLGGWKTARFNLIFAIPVLLITMIINPLSNHQGVTVLFYLNYNPITLEAVLYGLASAVMLVSMMMWFSCFSKIITSDKIIYLFGRIAPVLALLFSMCFRFVPLFKTRYREIHEGQKGMGRQFPKKSLIKKARLFAKELSILIAWSLEASIETSDSMEARGYGLRGRTSFHVFKFTKRDRNVLPFILIPTVIVAVGCFFGVNNIYYYPAIVFPSSALWTGLVAGGYLLLLALPIIIDIKGEYFGKE